MEIVSVNVGAVREVAGPRGPVLTGIFKSPVAGRRRLLGNRVEGDGVADLRVHGGPEKAVYAYPSEHYAPWQRDLAVAALPWGAFGENLTTRGLDESEVRAGDRFRVGTAELVAKGPRRPCYKLAIRLGRPDIVDLYNRSGRCGVYFGIAREGEAGAGDAIALLERDPRAPTILALFRGEAR